MFPKLLPWQPGKLKHGEEGCSGHHKASSRARRGLMDEPNVTATIPVSVDWAEWWLHRCHQNCERDLI